MTINLHLGSLGCINQTGKGGSVCAACQQAAVLRVVSAAARRVCVASPHKQKGSRMHEIENLQWHNLQRLTQPNPQPLTPCYFHHHPSTLWGVCDGARILDRELAQSSNENAAGKSILWKDLLPIVSKLIQYHIYLRGQEVQWLMAERGGNWKV